MSCERFGELPPTWKLLPEDPLRDGRFGLELFRHRFT
jgi:hypothetical protein